MNVDLGALGSYLHHTLLSVGVDAVLPSTRGMALLSTAVAMRAALSLLTIVTLRRRPPPTLGPPCQPLMVWIVIYLNHLWIVTIQMTPWINS